MEQLIERERSGEPESDVVPRIDIDSAQACETSRSQAVARLRVVTGCESGREIWFGSELVVGSGKSADLCIADAGISVRQLRIARVAKQGYRLVELGDLGDVRVNGCFVRDGVLLRSGDWIEIGEETKIVFDWMDGRHDDLDPTERDGDPGREEPSVQSAVLLHDLKNLLAALDYSVEFLQCLPPATRIGDPDVRECHDDLREAVRRATELGSQLVNPPVETERAEQLVDVGKLLEEVADLASYALPQSIELEVSTLDELWVRGQSTSLHQLLLNLILNARDAMPTGGWLILAMSGAVEVDGRDYVTIIVRDTGFGLDEATRSRAVEPFDTTKKDQGGTGLGLSSSAEICRRHGGWLELESAIGVGTSVRVYLPLCASRSEGDGVCSSLPRHSRRDGRRPIWRNGPLEIYVTDDASDAA